jgi:hypothetical protein
MALLKRMISNTVLLWKKTPVQRVTAAELDLTIAIITETPQYDLRQEIMREIVVDDDDPCSLEFGQQDLLKRLYEGIIHNIV